MNKAMLNAIVQVEMKGSSKGKVELKVHNPGKKGATLELRKMSDFDYEHVVEFKVFLTSLIDAFIAGENLDQVIISNKKPIAKDRTFGISSNPKLFTCDICGFQSKFGSALKAHKTRIHTFNCAICEFKTDNQVALKSHNVAIHKPSNKRVKSVLSCEVANCESTFETKGN